MNTEELLRQQAILLLYVVRTDISLTLSEAAIEQDISQEILLKRLQDTRKHIETIKSLLTGSLGDKLIS